MDLATQRNKRKVKKIAKWVGISIIGLSALLFAVFSSLGLSFFTISGNSMAPALKDGESIVLKQSDGVEQGLLFFFNKPPKWDAYATDSNRVLVKRIAATGGDTFSFDGEKFFVNDEMIYDTVAENFECSAGEAGYSHTLQQNQILVFGDNAKESLDSRAIFCDGDSDSIYLMKRDLVDYGTVWKKF